MIFFLPKKFPSKSPFFIRPKNILHLPPQLLPSQQSLTSQKYGFDYCTLLIFQNQSRILCRPPKGDEKGTHPLEYLGAADIFSANVNRCTTF